MAAWEDELSDPSVLGVPLLSTTTSPPPSGPRGRPNVRFTDEIRELMRSAFTATTDEAFIRSEVNGRRSRRIVLFAFFCTDVIGAVLWATWCQSWWGRDPDSKWAAEGWPEAGGREQRQACSSLGINHFVLLGLSVPVEGIMLFLAGRNPWSFWSDGLLLPLWLIRLGLFDVLLWNVPPQTLVVDALWFSVMAVMCRVHSLALAILVVSQVVSLLLVFQWHGALILDDLNHVRYGIYSIAMLVIMAGAYTLDEQSRLQSFSQLMSLQDQNAMLAERMLRWKVLPGNASSDGGAPEGSALSPSRLLKVPALVASMATGAWSRLATPPEAELGAGGSSEGPDSAAEGAVPLASAAPEPRVRERRASGERRSVRFSLPQVQSGEKRHTVPTQKPSAGLGFASRPQRTVDLMDVME